MAWNDGLEEGTPAHTLAASTSPTIRALAGPGSGKSFAIKRRVAKLLEEGVEPDKILAITFTRTAAQDIQKEISSLGIKGADDVHSRTLHSHALKILMQAEILEKTGRRPRMVIEHEIAPALSDINNGAFEGVREMDKLLSSYLAAWATLQSDEAGFVKDDKQRQFEEELVKWLAEHGGLLVGEVIPVAITYLRGNPASPEIGKYDFILVDEYQDLNKSEQEFIRLIRDKAGIVIVGDDDQSIYSFKHAHPEGIREIDKMHGKYEDVTFDECRRCPQHVTRIASTLIKRNPKRTLGDLKPHAKNHEGIVQIVQWRTYYDEVEGLASIVAKEIAAGKVLPQDVLIMAPRRLIGYRLRNKLVNMGVAVKSYFRESAIQKQQVKRAYSLMSFVYNSDDKISLRYLLGFGSADYRKKQYEKLKEIAKAKKLSLTQVLDALLDGGIVEKGLRTVTEEYIKIKADANALRKAIIDDKIDALANFFIKTDEDELYFYELNQLYRKAVHEQGEEVDLSSAAEFDRWFRLVFGSLQEGIAMLDSPDNLEHARIMSLHASKGLSAKLVIMSSMIEQLVPYLKEGLSEEEVVAAIEEQRRLFYVALTRCKSTPEYPGRLIVSSFIEILGHEAARMGIRGANPRRDFYANSTRYLVEIAGVTPKPVLGNTLL